ncbi:MAG: ribosome maturation factor RimP [Micavibrio sp.]|nr:ribosome maturation factor RimP [Micavibrio sp.]|tara:strand:- start:255 stop:749 length:495 start_codon:yes stop_codon:yes gene_type:complete
MKLTPLEKRLSDLARPVIEDLGFKLVCVKHLSDNGGTVQIMAEDPATGRLGVDDAAKISRGVSVIFDVEDPIKGAYRLEVSSPGIDRPLTRLEDFETYKGFEVKLESEIPSENGQRKFRGFIEALENEVITLKTDQGEANIPFNTLVKAKLVLTDDLIKRTANK